MTFPEISSTQSGDVNELQYGGPSGQLQSHGKLGLGNKELSVKQVPTDDDINGTALRSTPEPQPTIQRSDSLQSLEPSLRNRTVRPQLDISGGRTAGNWAARIILAPLGAVAGLAVGGGLGFAGGAAAGGITGGVATLWSGPGAVAGAMAGATAGAAIGVGAGMGIGAASGFGGGVALADAMFARPQKAHLDLAMHSLTGSRGGFTASEAQNLENVTDQEWRSLLHVPDKKWWRSADKTVGNRQDRQTIRTALVLHIARNGKVGAADYKKALIAAANSKTDGALQNAIRRQEAVTDAKELYATQNGREFNALMRRLGLERGDLPGDIQAKINRAIDQQFQQAPTGSVPDPADLEKTISGLLANEAATLAANSNDTARDLRAVHAIVAHEARYATDSGSFLRAGHTGSRQLKQILEKHERGYTAQTINQTKQQVANGDLAGLGLGDVYAPRQNSNRPQQLKSTPEIEKQTQGAIQNLDDMMTAIVGGKNKEDIENAADRVPQELRGLLRTMAKAAKDNANPQAQGSPEDFARVAVLNSFVLRNFGSNLSPLPKRALPRDVWGPDQPDPTQKANLTYNSTLVKSAFMGPPKTETVFAQRGQPEWDQAQQQVKQARDAWFEPAAKFLNALTAPPKQLSEQEIDIGNQVALEDPNEPEQSEDVLSQSLSSNENLSDVSDLHDEEEPSYARPSKLIEEVKADGAFPIGNDMTVFMDELLNRADSQRPQALSESDRNNAKKFMEEMFNNWSAIAAHDRDPYSKKMRNIPEIDQLIDHMEQTLATAGSFKRFGLEQAFMRGQRQEGPMNLVSQGIKFYRQRELGQLPKDSRKISGPPTLVEHIKALSPYANKTGALNDKESFDLQTNLYPKLLKDLAQVESRKVGGLFGKTQQLPVHSRLDTAVQKLGTGHKDFPSWMQSQLERWANTKTQTCGQEIVQQVVAVLEQGDGVKIS